MIFSTTIQEQFEKAGWFSGRKSPDKYDNLYLNLAPPFLKEFLLEYGALVVSNHKNYESVVDNKLLIQHTHCSILSKEDDFDKTLFKNTGELFFFAYTSADGYEIACDSKGRVYMIGDYIFRISNSFQDGIVKLITDDWSNGYVQLDEKNGLWMESKI